MPSLGTGCRAGRALELVAEVDAGRGNPSGECPVSSVVRFPSPWERFSPASAAPESALRTLARIHGQRTHGKLSTWIPLAQDRSAVETLCIYLLQSTRNLIGKVAQILLM